MSATSREDSTGLDAAGELRELRHELGNALTAASAHVYALLRRLPAWAEPRDRQALEAIRDSHLRARDLLHPAPVAFPPTRCDLQALIALAVSQVPPERAADLLVNVRTETPLIGCGHPERIVQVLANLLDNAVKYSPPGTPIEVESYWVSEAARDWALISVSDQGIGISAEAMQAVFSGYRTAAACQTAPGSGLGLQLSRRLIEAEGGQLWAMGRPGPGSSFCMKLPLAIVTAEAPAPGDRWESPEAVARSSAGVPHAATVVTPTANRAAGAGACGPAPRSAGGQEFRSASDDASVPVSIPEDPGVALAARNGEVTRAGAG